MTNTIFSTVINSITRAIECYNHLVVHHSRGSNSDRHLPWNITLATPLCYNNDATQVYS